MPSDQKISELPVANAIVNSDASLLVNNGSDYQFTMSLLLQYVSSNINTGINFSSGTILPQNTAGKNGDVFLNTTNGAIAQKSAGSWIIIYTPPAQPSNYSGNTFLYGLGVPAPALGTYGDSYINTADGTFYKKTTGIWKQTFSMQSGPAGPVGVKGDTGLPGSNGNSLLNGSTNPSNQNTGKDGDFYLNTNTYTLFGPKANGIWGAGAALIQSPPPPVVIDIPVGTTVPVTINEYQSAYAEYSDYPTLLIQEVTGSATVKERTDIQPICQFKNSKLDSIRLDIPGNDANTTINHLQLIIKA